MTHLKFPQIPDPSPLGRLLSIGIQLHAMSAEGVAETQAGFVQVILTEVLHQTVEVHTAATQELLPKCEATPGSGLERRVVKTHK